MLKKIMVHNFNNKRIRVSKRKKIEDCLFASGEIDNKKY